MRYVPPPALLVISLLLSIWTCAPLGALEIDDVLKQSSGTGTPILALVTSPYCPPCQKLKYRLENDDELQSLLKQYVAIHFDTSDPAFADWSQKYPPRSKMVPMLFIVSSSGRLLYNASGAPNATQLPQLLQRGLQVNNKLTETKKRAFVLDEATTLVEQRDYAEAIRTLKPVWKKRGEPQPDDVKVDDDKIEELKTKLQEVGQSNLDRAKIYLADERHQLFGLLALAKVRREFRDMPELSAQADELLQQAQQEPQVAGQLSQAELIDRGRDAEQSGDHAAAIEIYQRAATTFRGSLAEQLCTVRIRQLEEVKVATRAGKPPAPSTTR